MTRVLVLCGDRGVPLHGPSGASSHLRGVIRGFVELGYCVEVGVASRTDHRGDFAPVHNVPVTIGGTGRPRRRFRELREWRDGRRLAHACLSLAPPDLIYERFSLFCDAGMYVARHLQSRGVAVEHLVEVNAPLTLERTNSRRLDHPFLARCNERRVLRAADRVVVVSHWLKTWALDRGARSVHRVVNGSESQAIETDGSQRDRLNLRSPVLGFVGSLRPWHGLDILPRLLEQMPTATALIIGDGPHPPPSHPRITHLPAGPQDQLDQLLGIMDVALAPYPADAPPYFSPLKIQDYRAAGIPIVASDVGEMRQLVGTGGEVVLPDDPVAWAAAIRRQLTCERTVRPRPWRCVVQESIGGMAVSPTNS